MQPNAQATLTPAERERDRLPALDLAERVFLLVVLGWFVSRMAMSLSAEPLNILLMVSESLPVLMLLLRTPGQIATTWYAWTIAFIGTFGPLLVVPATGAIEPVYVAGLLMAAGLLISIAAKICLNRSFGIVAANRGVKRTGPYRLVRHPMYFGYLLTHIGFLLLNPALWNLAVYAVTWSAILLRIPAEERFLGRDPAYRSYAARVRYRLIPGLL